MGFTFLSLLGVLGDTKIDVICEHDTGTKNRAIAALLEVDLAIGFDAQRCKELFCTSTALIRVDYGGNRPRIHLPNKHR